MMRRGLSKWLAAFVLLIGLGLGTAVLATIPSDATKQHLGVGDPRQAGTELASLVDKVNQLLAHLRLSTITNDPLGIGDGLEANGTPPTSTLRVKLNGSTLTRGSTGIAVNAGVGANQIVQLNGSGALPAVNGANLTGIVSVPTGAVSMFAGGSAPSGWLLCNGAAVSRTTFSALFAVVGTTYGAGDGSTTFNVPDMRSRVAIGAGQGSGLSNRALAATGGSENSFVVSHTHTQQGTFTSGGFSANHTHNVPIPGQSAGLSAGSNVFQGSNQAANFTNNITSGTASVNHTHNTTISGQTASTGSSATGGRMQPFLSVTCIIKTEIESEQLRMFANLNRRYLPAFRPEEWHIAA